MTPEEAMAFLGTDNPVSPELPQPAPMTNEQAIQALQKSETQRSPLVSGKTEVPMMGNAGYVQRNAQPGVRLDVQDEVGPWIALMTAFRSEKDQKLKFLADVFGPDNVRADDQGDPLIRVTDKSTGQPKDIPLNASGMSVNDLMTVVSAIPQGAVALKSIMTGRGIPKIGQVKGAKGFLRDVTAGSIGAEAAGAAQDVATRAYDEMPIELSDILYERAKQVPADMAMDFALAGAGRVANFAKRGITQGDWGVASPLWRFRGNIQNDAIEAQKFIKDKTGIDIPMTAAETTGIPFIAKLYEYVYKHPAGASPILAEREVKDAAKKAFQEWLIEPATLADDELIGRQAIQMLDALKSRTAEGVESAAKAAKTDITQRIGSIGGKISNSPQMAFEEVGDSVRKKIVSGRDTAKAEQRAMREEIASMEGGTGKIFDSQIIGLQDRAKKQLAGLPAPEKTITEQSTLIDEFGNSQKVTKTGQVLEKEFVPSKVVERLKSLTEDKKYSLSDLIQMRSDVYEDITAGQAVPNTGTHYLNEIGKMLTSAIDEGIEKLPNGQLKTKLVAANKQYKEKVIPYESSGISDLFKQVTEPGFVENTDVVSRLMRDGDKYQRTVQFIGTDSAEHKALKRSVFDQLMIDSAEDLEGKVLNPQSLARNLREMAKNPKTRAIFKDVFGPKGQQIANESSFLESVNMIESGKIPKEDLEKVLTGNAPASLKSLVSAYKKKQEVFNNKVIRDLVSGELEPSKIKSEDFVNYFVDAGSFSEIAQAWGHLASDPQLQDQIRRKMIEQVFARARRSVEPADIAAKLRGDKTHVVSSDALYKALGNDENQKKLALIIGKDRMDLLKASTSMQAAEDWAKMEAGETGIFASGNAVGGVLRMKPSVTGLSKEAMDFIKYKMIAVMISSPGFRKAISSTYTPKEIPWLAKAVVTSQPFVEAVVEDAGNNSDAFQTLLAAKRLVGLSVDTPQGPKQQQNVAQPNDLKDFLESP